MKYYILRNDELGYIDDCPTFTNKYDAENVSAGKCRMHSVVEITKISQCHPVNKLPQCADCPRFAGCQTNKS